MLLNISTKARKVAIAAVGAAALTTVALSGAATASAKAAPSSAVRGHAAVHGMMRSSLACTNAGGEDSGIGIVSQNFTDSGGSFDIYDSQGADDFAVTSKCKISTVTAAGVYFNGPGAATSENVIVYKDAGGAPGAVKAKYKKVHGSDSAGVFTITLPTALVLKAGTYWISVQANMAFGTGGEWGWEMTSTTQNGNASQWKNPGDGLGTGCTVYTTTTTCIAAGEGPDFLFTLG